MTEGQPRPPQAAISEALRVAVDRTLSAAGRSARVGSAALDPERRAELLDEIARRGVATRDELAKRGQGARDEIARRGQEAGAELSRRGHEARDELARRLELLESRLASLEELLRSQAGSQSKAKPKAED